MQEMVVAKRILVIRGQKVMIDSDLAEIYSVTTKRFNEQVRRNINRFPADFMFQLTVEEKAEVVANCDHLANLKYSPHLPYVFTEHGAIMAASVLNSPKAVDMSVFVVRAFVRMREILSTHKQLAEKLQELEYVTPNQRHTGQDKLILAHRRTVYQRAKNKNPERWSGQTRTSTAPAEVILNKQRTSIAEKNAA